MRENPLIIEGEWDTSDTPDWTPLENLALRECAEFMWMFTVICEHSRRLQVYKHIWTRRYIHLDGTGAAFVYRSDGRYEQVDALWLLDRVLMRPVGEAQWELQRERLMAEES
jgi:hypothetical protein